MRRLLLLLLLLCFTRPADAQRITRETIVDRTLTSPYLGVLFTPTGDLLINHAVSRPSPTAFAMYFQLVSRHLDSLSSGPVLANSEWRTQATVRVSTGGYAVATTVVSPNWPAERTDLAFYRYANPLALPRLTRIHDLDGGSNDYSYDLLAAPDGYYIGAAVVGRADRQRFKLLKTDTTGTVLWQKNYGISLNDFIVGLRYTAEGNILLAGESSPLPSGELRLRLLLVNPQGDSLNTLLYAYPQPLGPNATLRAPAAVEDRLLSLRGGGFAMLAELDTTGATYAVLVKVNRRLQPQWQYTFRAPPLFGLTRRTFFAGACELRDSSVLVLATNQLGLGSSNPFYLLRLNGRTGQLQNTYPIFSTFCSTFQATKLLPDGDSALFVLGLCAAGNPTGTYAAHLSLRGLPGVVLAPSPTGTAPAPTRLFLDALYPNPANEAVMFSYRCPPGLTGPGSLCLRDLLGREVSRWPVVNQLSGHITVPLSLLASGLYVCALTWPGQGSATRKLVVQH